MNTNDYRFTRYPGAKFSHRIVSDRTMTIKLSNILNYYVGAPCKDKLLSAYLKTTLLNKKFYWSMGLVGMLVGILCLLDILPLFCIMPVMIYEVLIGIGWVLFYENACDYKQLNQLLSRLTITQLIFHADKMQRAVNEEEKEYSSKNKRNKHS